MYLTKNKLFSYFKVLSPVVHSWYYEKVHPGADIQELPNSFTKFTDSFTNFIETAKQNFFMEKQKVYNDDAYRSLPKFEQLFSGFSDFWYREDEVEVDDTEGTTFKEIKVEDEVDVKTEIEIRWQC